MKFIILSFVLLAFFSSCGNGSKNQATKDAIPACLQEQINEIEKKTFPNPPVQIDEYEYQGKKVFLFTADCCDQYNTLYNSDCKSICAPSGGFTGRGDGKCSDFDSTAKHVKLVWKKAG